MVDLGRRDALSRGGGGTRGRVPPARARVPAAGLRCSSLTFTSITSGFPGRRWPLAPGGGPGFLEWAARSTATCAAFAAERGPLQQRWLDHLAGRGGPRSLRPATVVPGVANRSGSARWRRGSWPRWPGLSDRARRRPAPPPARTTSRSPFTCGSAGWTTSWAATCPASWPRPGQLQLPRHRDQRGAAAARPGRLSGQPPRQRPLLESDLPGPDRSRSGHRLGGRRQPLRTPAPAHPERLAATGRGVPDPAGRSGGALGRGPRRRATSSCAAATASGYTVAGDRSAPADPPRIDGDGDGYFLEADPDDRDPARRPAPRGGCDPAVPGCPASSR